MLIVLFAASWLPILPWPNLSHANLNENRRLYNRSIPAMEWDAYIERTLYRSKNFEGIFFILLHLLNRASNIFEFQVFHGAEHDIEWLQRDFGIYVVNMFDTGRAMRRLEMQKFNLRYLVHHYCDVSLDKKYQLADWRVRWVLAWTAVSLSLPSFPLNRPLDQDMIAYARSDTHYLLHCYDCLREELLEKGDKLQNLLRVVYSESALICSRVWLCLSCCF